MWNATAVWPVGVISWLDSSRTRPLSVSQRACRVACGALPSTTTVAQTSLLGIKSSVASLGVLSGFTERPGTIEVTRRSPAAPEGAAPGAGAGAAGGCPGCGCPGCSDGPQPTALTVRAK